MEDGTYLARAVNGALGKTNGGKEQIAVEFQLEGNEVGDGERIMWFGYFSDAAVDRTVESLRHCGWRGNDLDNLEGIGENAVQLVIKSEEYNGKWYKKVQWVNAANAGFALKAPLAPDEAKSFSARMRGRIAAMAAAGPKPRPAPRSSGVLSPEPPPFAESANLDDIPF